MHVASLAVKIGGGLYKYLLITEIMRLKIS